MLTTALILALSATAEPTPTPAAPAATPTSVVVPPAAPAPGEVIRLVGDASIAVREDRGNFYFGDGMAVTTPLPEGYPQPTPTGVIEMKTYPVVRRAEVSGKLNPAVGMNLGFFPLFRHIQRRDIEMTSPVEMDYRGWDAEPGAEGGGPTGWTMSFLYRRRDQGPPGPDERDRTVTVVDAPPVTVIAVGLRGSYGLGRIRQGVVALYKWLDAQDEWEVAGDPRAFYYNGPDARDRDKWAEAQLPVRRKAQPATPQAPAPAPTAAPAPSRADE
jgi:hypothetical protein